MKRFALFFNRYWILSKRLLKRPAFIAILLLIPFLVVTLRVVGTGSDGGIMTVAIAAEDRKDVLAREIIMSLTEDSPLIRYLTYDAVEDAVDAVENGSADAAWIFPKGMAGRIEAFTKGLTDRYAVVTVVERENNILMLLSHEVLASALYPYCARQAYRDFVYGNIITLSDISAEELNTYFDAAEVEGEDLFLFTGMDGGEQNSDGEGAYLLAPIRGILSIFVLICGLAAALFYMQDEAKGKWHWLRFRARFPFAALYHMTAVGIVSVAVVLSIFFAGLSVSMAREVSAMLLYALMTVGFVILLGRVFREIRVFGALIPVLCFACIALCPVFFDLNILSPLACLLPPYYYLHVVYDASFFPQALFYTAWVWGLDALCFRLRR